MERYFPEYFYNEQIARLGFEAWVDNVFANSIENFVMEGSGEMTIENEKFNQFIKWDDKNIELHIRCHTTEGWKESSRTIKR